MDCLPLAEGTFKKAIMGNSGGDKIKFNTELTTKEVSNSFPRIFDLPKNVIYSSFPSADLLLSI